MVTVLIAGQLLSDTRGVAVHTMRALLQKESVLLMTEWTSGEQKALERAIALVPKELAPAERWAKISDLVPGRSAKECVARYKELVQIMKEKKAQGQA